MSVELSTPKPTQMLRLHKNIVEAYRPSSVVDRPVRKIGGLALYQGATVEVIESRKEAKTALLDAASKPGHADSVVVAIDEIARHDTMTAFYLTINILTSADTDLESRDAFRKLLDDLIARIPDDDKQEALDKVSQLNTTGGGILSLAKDDEQRPTDEIRQAIDKPTQLGMSIIKNAIKTAEEGRFTVARILQQKIENLEEREECAREIDRILYMFADSEAALGRFVQARSYQDRIEDNEIKVACSEKIDTYLSAHADRLASIAFFSKARHLLASIQDSDLNAQCSLAIDRHLMNYAIRLATEGNLSKATTSQLMIADISISRECAAELEIIFNKKQK